MFALLALASGCSKAGDGLRARSSAETLATAQCGIGAYLPQPAGGASASSCAPPPPNAPPAQRGSGQVCARTETRGFGVIGAVDPFGGPSDRCTDVYSSYPMTPSSGVVHLPGTWLTLPTLQDGFTNDCLSGSGNGVEGSCNHQYDGDVKHNFATGCYLDQNGSKVCGQYDLGLASTTYGGPAIWADIPAYTYNPCDISGRYTFTSATPFWCDSDPGQNDHTQPPVAYSSAPDTGQPGPEHCGGDPIDYETGAQLEQIGCFSIGAKGYPLDASIRWSSKAAYEGSTSAFIGAGFSTTFSRKVVYTPPPPPKCSAPAPSVTCTGITYNLQVLDEKGGMDTYQLTDSPTSISDGHSKGLWTFVPQLLADPTSNEYGHVTMEEDDSNPAAPTIIYKMYYRNGDVDTFTSSVTPASEGTVGPYGPMLGMLKQAKNRLGNSVDIVWQQGDSDGGSDCTADTCATEILTSSATGGRLERLHRFVQVADSDGSGATHSELRLVAVREGLNLVPGQDASKRRQITLGYDAQQRLGSVTDLDGNTLHYRFDDNNMMVERCDQNQDSSSPSRACMTVEYDGGWIVKKQTQPSGTVLNLNWRDFHGPNLGYDLEVVSSSPNSQETRANWYQYQYSSIYTFFYLTPHFTRMSTSFLKSGPSIPAGTATGPSGWAAQDVDSVFGWVTASYDERGRKTQYCHTKNINGANDSCPWELDGVAAHGVIDTPDLMAVRQVCGDSQGDCSLVTRYGYDAYADLVSRQLPDGVSESYGYDATTGKLQSVTRAPIAGSNDAAAQTWRFLVDDAGLVRRTVAPDQSVTAFDYDALGYPKTIVRDAEPTGGRTPLALATSTTYDWRGYLTSATDLMGVTSTYGRDNSGLLTQLTSPSPSGTGPVSMTIAYDHVGNAVRIVDDAGSADQRVTLRDYLPEGPAGAYRVVRTTDAAGAVTVYQYDPLLGEVAAAIEQSSNNRTTTYGYSPAGGWLAKVTRADGSIPVQRVYNADGSVAVATDGRGVAVQYTYDPQFPRLASQLDGYASQNDPLAPGFALAGYVALGASGQYTTTGYGYDRQGRFNSLLRQTSYPYTAPVMTATFDGLSRPKSAVDADSNQWSMQYDVLGRLIARSLTDSKGALQNRWSWQRDALGRATQSTVASPDGQTRTSATSYLAAGVSEGWSVKTTTNPRGLTASFSYGPSGQLAQTVDTDGSTWSYGYNPFGELYRRTNPLAGTITYQRDGLGRLIDRRRDGGGLSRDEQWHYNADSTTAWYVDAAGRKTTFDYDSIGRRQQVHFPQPTPGSGDEAAADVVFGYYGNDALQGAKTGDLASNTEQTIFWLDSLNRPHQLIRGYSDVAHQSQQRWLTFAYDGTGRPTTMTYRPRIDGGGAFNGDVTYHWPDGVSSQLARLVPFGVADGADGQITLGWNGRGAVTSVNRQNHFETSIAYDGFGEVRLQTDGSWDNDGRRNLTLATHRYQYDANGNVEMRSENDYQTLFSYDALDRLATVSGEALGGTSYQTMTRSGELLVGGDFAGGLDGWATWCDNNAGCAATATAATTGAATITLTNGTVGAVATARPGSAFVARPLGTTVHSGDQLLVTVLAKGAVGGEDVYVALADSANTQVNVGGQLCGLSTRWTLCGVLVTVPAAFDGHSLTALAGLVYPANATVQLSDMHVGPFAGDNTGGSQKLYNPQFTEDELNWSVFGSKGSYTSLSLVSTDEGQSLKMGRQSGTVSIYQRLPLPLVGGTRYAVEAQTQGLAGGELVQVSLSDAVTGAIAGVEQCTAATSWQSCVAHVTVPAALDGRLAVVSVGIPDAATANATVLVDNVQLRSEERSSAFVYDGVGNILQGDNGTFRYDGLAEQATTHDGAPLRYDDNGNLTFDGALVYTYDTANRLVRSVDATSGRTVQYHYDALGRLVRQETLGGDGIVLGQLELTLDNSSGLSRIAIVAGQHVDATTGKVVDDWYENYTWGPTGLWARTHVDTTVGATAVEYQALLDQDGSVSGWLDANRTLTGARRFDVWGNVVGGGTADAGFIGYHGEWHNPDGTIYLRNRIYHPGLHRFLQYDPIGDTQRNGYAYADDNPASLADPLGLSACDKTAGTAPNQQHFTAPQSCGLSCALNSRPNPEDDPNVFFGQPVGMTHGQSLAAGLTGLAGIGAGLLRNPPAMAGENPPSNLLSPLSDAEMDGARGGSVSPRLGIDDATALPGLLEEAASPALTSLKLLPPGRMPPPVRGAASLAPELDFASTPDNGALWNKQPARQAAEAALKNTLESTTGGQQLEQESAGRPWSEMAPEWDYASDAYVRGLSGDVDVFVSPAGSQGMFPSADTHAASHGGMYRDSVLFQRELPNLWSNPNVGRVTFHHLSN